MAAIVSAEPTPTTPTCGGCHWHSDRPAVRGIEHRYPCARTGHDCPAERPACTAFTERAGRTDKEGR